MPDYRTAFGSFLKTEDLAGKAVKLTIDHVTQEVVGEEKEKKLVATFVGKDKRLTLNRTNADSIAEIAGDCDYENWNGVTIVLFPDTTKYAGKTVPCMRIRSAAAKPAPVPAPVEEELLADDVPF